MSSDKYGKMSDVERALYGDTETYIESFTDMENKVAETTSSTRSKRQSMDVAGSVFLISSDGRMLSLPISSESPNDPLNWTRSRRIFVYAVLFFYASIALFLIQCPENLFKAFAREFAPEDMAPFTLDTLAGSPTLCMGISFLFWIPLSVAFGRRPIIFLSSVVLSVSTLWTAFAGSFHSLLAAICFTGIAVGATLSTIILQIIDLTFIHERPLGLATFWAGTGCLALFLLAALPSMQDTAQEWRPIYQGMSIPSVIMTFMIYFFVPETFFFRPPVAFDGRVLVQSSTERVKVYDEWVEVPDEDMSSSQVVLEDSIASKIEMLPASTWRVSPLSLFRRSICNPKAAAVCLVQVFMCLANPLVFWVALLNAVNFGGMMSIGTGFPVVMARPPYNLPQSAISKVSVTAGLASLLALPLSYLMLNNIMKYFTLRNRGVRHAEYYLPAFILPVTTGAASVLIYGFAAARHWDPAFYHVAYGLNAFSFSSISVANTVWVTESLPQWAAPAIAVVGGVSYIASWGITAALPAWLGAWGEIGVNVGIGIGIMLVGLLAIPLAFWGNSVRQYINGRFGAYQTGALRPQSMKVADQY